MLTYAESMEDERAIDDKEFAHVRDISSGWGLFFSPDFDVTQVRLLRMLTYAAYADVCWRMLTYADRL
jgi:hypothetical protein